MPRSSESDFPRRLRTLREAAGLTQTDLAERIGWTKARISALECDIRYRPRRETVVRLAAGLGCAPADLDPALSAIEVPAEALLSARCPSSRESAPVTGSRYKVRVTKDYLVFCSGHFITYAGDRCERLHGHNYRTAVEVEDDLDENHYVFDFIALKDLTRAVIDELDHRMLLPTRSRLIHMEEEGPNWTVRYHDRHWSFPRDECALVPIANTTAELLADHIGVRLRQEILKRGLTLPRVMRIEVEESFGQSAESEWRREVDPSA